MCSHCCTMQMEGENCKERTQETQNGMHCMLVNALLFIWSFSQIFMFKKFSCMAEEIHEKHSLWLRSLSWEWGSAIEECKWLSYLMQFANVFTPGSKRNRCPQRSKGQTWKESRRTYMARTVRETVKGIIVNLFVFLISSTL